jgi:heme exporter protein D
MSHAFYVYSAWGISAVVLAVMIGLIWFESGRLRRELKRLEAQGIRRRSAEPVSGEQA